MGQLNPRNLTITGIDTLVGRGYIVNSDNTLDREFSLYRRQGGISLKQDPKNGNYFGNQ